MNRTITALALTAVALFGLTACTGTTAPSTSSGVSQPGVDSGSEQSVADACALIQETIVDATGDFENAQGGDPAAVVEAMKTAAGKLAEASSQVTNAEVAALLPSLQEMFQRTSDVMQALVDGDASKLGDMAELGQSFQDTSERFQELCAS